MKRDESANEEQLADVKLRSSISVRFSQRIVGTFQDDVDSRGTYHFDTLFRFRKRSCRYSSLVLCSADYRTTS
jgi:hypothetical protein